MNVQFYTVPRIMVAPLRCAIAPAASIAMLRCMPTLHPFVADFQEGNRNLLKRQAQHRAEQASLRDEWHRLVSDCAAATKAKKTKRAKVLLRRADEVRAKIDR